MLVTKRRLGATAECDSVKQKRVDHPPGGRGALFPLLYLLLDLEAFPWHILLQAV